MIFKNVTASCKAVGVLILFAAGSVLANESILPQDETYSSDIPTPDSVLGWPVGTWHARPEQITQYFNELADTSAKASVQTIGVTHEQRPLIHLTITSEENQRNLDELRLQHLDGDGPLVIWLGYSIHGNESSGSNAAMLVAYHLLAGDAPWIDELLQDTIVMIDPMLNPDGLARFATWANMHRGQVPVADPEHREHNEAWPSGRFNHYWFDMNRDWLPLTQPESVARIRQFQQWKPHIFGDFHEQGANAGYFFQPGEPKRTNPLTSDENQRLTTELAKYHAAALDEIGERYFTRERFDDFYYGKGSTYPDVQGTVGILFEQASARGHRVESINGEFSFADAVRNHYATSLSTLKGGYALQDELKTWKQSYTADTGKRARTFGVGAWVFGDHGQSGRAAQLAEVLHQHDIQVYSLDEAVEIGGNRFAAGDSFYVPVNQPQASLIQSIFEQRTEFEDQAFYDVSAWTLPLAYNLKFGSLKSVPTGEVWLPKDDSRNTVSTVTDSNAVAWRFNGDSLEAGALAIALANADVPVFRVVSPGRILTENSSIQQGDFLVARLHNQDTAKTLGTLNEMLDRWPVRVEAMSSGLNLNGSDLGSRGVMRVKPVRPLLLTGKGLNPMEAGHIWHLIDRRLNIALPMQDVAYGLPDLSRYTHILIADGQYNSIPKAWIDDLDHWVKQGGVLISQKRSAEWAGAVWSRNPAEDAESADEARERRLIALTDKPDVSLDDLGPQRYADHDKAEADRALGGAIFSAITDTSHPLLTGVYTDQMPVFLNRVVRMEPSPNAWTTPMRLGEQSAPVAGHASEWVRDQMQDQPLLIAERIGRGASIRFAFNANFRAFWRGTEQLYINALINGSLINSTSLDSD